MTKGELVFRGVDLEQIRSVAREIAERVAMITLRLIARPYVSDSVIRCYMSMNNMRT